MAGLTTVAPPYGANGRPYDAKESDFVLTSIWPPRTQGQLLPCSTPAAAWICSNEGPKFRLKFDAVPIGTGNPDSVTRTPGLRASSQALNRCPLAGKRH
jgi:hypothetical protein